MPAKTQIIGELGQDALLLPDRVQSALTANDRIKLVFTLLQEAERHADHPDRPQAPFIGQALGADGAVDAQRAIAESRRLGDGSLLVPGASRLRALIAEDLAAMLAPLTLADAADAKALAARQAALLAALPGFAEDRIPAGIVDAVTAADRRRGDSLHLLVMDLHKAINALAGGLVEEDIDGARAWRIADGDRSLVRAFMAGVNRTAPLKFDHPGLGTTATRIGERLVIQNDIGTTDAHVLVLQIEGSTATLTYTDVHAPRLAFFQSLFKPFAVEWQDTASRQSDQLAEGDNYYLCVGRFAAPDAAALERYVTFLGSRIVFLIDWNRARKRLREFLRKEDVVPLLKWAADQDLGHRGFLALGGERLLYDAIEVAQPAPLRYGEKLYDAIGPEAAVGFLKIVLRATAEGLLQRRSERFIRDEVRLELAGRFHSAEENLLSIAGEHAGLIFELATAVNDELARYGEAGTAHRLTRLADRAGRWEREADALVSRVRSLVQRSHQPDIYLELLREADDAADALEEAAHFATLLPKLDPAPAMLAPVQRLAALLVDGAQELVKLVETASHIHRDGAREDMQDFIEAVDRLVGIEHETDEIERSAAALLILEAPDFRVLHLLTQFASAFEQAADALSLSALMLKDHLLNDVVN
jgi:uncharacterized protein Yka (UPF0111/DUF47 family)